MVAPKEVDAPVCILGAGPHGLAMALHLCAADPALAERLVVVDPSGTWMATWREQFARLDIDVLRSPRVHHPGPEVSALSAYVSRHQLPTSTLPYNPPKAASFDAFAQHLVDESNLAPPIAHLPQQITPAKGGRLRVRLSNSSILTDRVVVATNPSRRNIPEWAETLPEIPTQVFAHAADVDLRKLDSPTGERITVVGAGLSAAHLAIGAAQRGARVTLVARRELRTRAFDTEPGWLGPKYLAAFEACPDPRARLDAAVAARGGGTMPEWAYDQLLNTGVRVLERNEITQVEWADNACQIHLRDHPQITSDRLWLATGTTPDLTVLRCLHPLLPDITTVDRLPVTDDDLRMGLHPIHTMGRLATITLGPAAGNLWGARQAALRITRAITGVSAEDLAERVSIAPKVSRMKRGHPVRRG